MSILSDQLFDGAKALDVGSGSGYLSACMGFMVGSRGRVVGIDHIPELIEISTRNVREDCPHFVKEGRIKFIGKAVRDYRRVETVIHGWLVSGKKGKHRLKITSICCNVKKLHVFNTPTRSRLCVPCHEESEQDRVHQLCDIAVRCIKDRPKTNYRSL